MARTTVGLGLDIGSSAVKLVELRKERDGIHVVRAVRLPTGLGPGDGGAAAEARTGEIIAEILGDPKSRKGELAIATQGASTFTRYAKLPPVAAGKMDQIVTYEAQQTLPFPLEEVIWAYQRLRSTDPTEANIILVAVKTELVEEMLTRLSSHKLVPSVIDNEPIAVYNALKASGDVEEGKTTVLLHLGARASDLSIERDGRLCWTTSIRVGAQRMVEALAEKLSVGFDEAERVLREEAAAPPVMPEELEQLDDRAKAIAEALGGVLDDLVFEVQRSIGYFRSQLRGKTVHKIVISGGAANLRDLAGYLSARLGSVVAVASPFNNLIADGDITPEDAADPAFSVAVGLALRGVTDCEININLLPPSVMAAKEAGRKIPYIGASCVLGAACVLLVGQMARDRADLYRQELQKVRSALSTYKRYEPQLKKAEREYSDIAGKIERIEKLVAERDRWPDVLLEVSRLCNDRVWIESFRTGEAEGTAAAPAPRMPRIAVGPGAIAGAGTPKPAGGAMWPGGGMQAGPVEQVAAGDTLLVTGYATDPDAFNDFLQRLSTSPLFSDVAPVSLPKKMWEVDGEVYAQEPTRGVVGVGTRRAEKAAPARVVYQFEVKLALAAEGGRQTARGGGQLL